MGWLFLLWCCTLGNHSITIFYHVKQHCFELDYLSFLTFLVLILQEPILCLAMDGHYTFIGESVTLACTFQWSVQFSAPCASGHLDIFTLGWLQSSTIRYKFICRNKVFKLFQINMCHSHWYVTALVNDIRLLKTHYNWGEFSSQVMDIYTRMGFLFRDSLHTMTKFFLFFKEILDFYELISPKMILSKFAVNFFGGWIFAKFPLHYKIKLGKHVFSV